MYSTASGSVAIAYVQALYNKANELVGVLSTDYLFGEPELQQFLRETLPSEDSQLAIVQERGELAAQSG